VDDAEAFPEFEELELDDVLEEEDESDTAFLELLSDYAVRVETEELEDGQQSVLLYFDGIGASEFASLNQDEEAEPNPLLPLLATTTDEVMVLGVLLDADGNMLRQVVETQFNFVDLDMAELGVEVPPGTLFSGQFASIEGRELDNSVTEFTPVEAPEM
jgi:hypothetical protein